MVFLLSVGFRTSGVFRARDSYYTQLLCLDIRCVHEYWLVNFMNYGSSFCRVWRCLVKHGAWVVS